MHIIELRKAIKLAGSQTILARKLDTSRAVINNWLNGGVRIPPEKALLTEAVFNGQIIAEKLSPHSIKTILTIKRYWKKTK